MKEDLTKLIRPLNLDDVPTKSEMLDIRYREIDRLTDDLLDIADTLEQCGINVQLENGWYLNPASKIRGKVDCLWEHFCSAYRYAKELDYEL